VESSAWAGRHENIFVIGPTGVGKSFLSCALAQKAYRDGTWRCTFQLLRCSGNWAMAPPVETERREFREICEDRYQSRSLILTSQMPMASWTGWFTMPRRSTCKETRCERTRPGAET